MKIVILILSSLIYATPLLCQKNIDINDTTIEQFLKMVKCSLDPSAKAMYISNSGVSQFTYNPQFEDFIYRFEKKILIKIFDKSLLTDSTFKILIIKKNFEKKNKVEGLRINIYDIENSRIEKTKIKNKYINYLIESNSLYLDNKTLAQVCKNGSIIEIKFTIPLDYKKSFQNWQFEQTIPVLKSEYISRIPSIVEYDYHLEGDINFEQKITLIEPGPILYYKIENIPKQGNVTINVEEKKITLNPSQPDIIIRKLIAENLEARTSNYTIAEYKFKFLYK